MIKVSKEEMELIKEFFPYVHATRTAHNYYVEERREVLSFLRDGYYTVEARYA